MLNQKEILKYAVKGLELEIDKLDKDIKKAKQMIEKLENGEKVAKTKPELIAILTKKIDEKEKLEKEKFEIEWQIEE